MMRGRLLAEWKAIGVDEQEQVKSDGAAVGWRFWVGSTALVLVPVVIGAFWLGLYVPIEMLESCAGTASHPLCITVIWYVVVGTPLGALLGLLAGVLAVWGIHRWRTARPASEEEPSAE
jgi:hypothetical protein